MKPCTMLEVPSPDKHEDVECGKPAAWQYKKDTSHVICQGCYDAFSDDEEIQREYEPLPKEVEHGAPE